MREGYRKRVQIRLPEELLEEMKKYLLTNADGNFSGNALSYYIERLIRVDIDNEQNPLKGIVKEDGKIEPKSEPT